MKLARLTVATGVALAALAFTGSGWAAYTPQLLISPTSNKPGKPTRMLLGHVQDLNDDATAKETIYVPPGYQVNLTQAIGAEIGFALGLVILRDQRNAEDAIISDVIVDNPANYPPETNQCTPGETHEAVWRIQDTVAGSPFTIVIYADHVTTGPEAAFASAKMQFCLLGPVGAPSGAQLVFALIAVSGVFRNPPNTAQRIWHALYTPYVPGSGTPNPAGTTEGQAVLAGTASVSLTVKRLRRGFVLVQGRVLADGRPVAGARIDVAVGGKVFHPKTNRSGVFTLRKRLKRKTRIKAEAFVFRDLPSCPAPPTGLAPQGCTSASYSFAATSKTVIARPRR